MASCLEAEVSAVALEDIEKAELLSAFSAAKTNLTDWNTRPWR